MDPNTDDPEAKVKDEIKKFEAMTTRIIQIVVREFRKNELKEYTIERKMHVASILFKANVLDKMDQQLITDLDKCIFYDAFLALFKKAGGYNTPTSTKPNPDAPTFRGERISGIFADQISNFEDVIREWNKAKKR